MVTGTNTTHWDQNFVSSTLLLCPHSPPHHVTVFLTPQITARNTSFLVAHVCPLFQHQPLCHNGKDASIQSPPQLPHLNSRHTGQTHKEGTANTQISQMWVFMCRVTPLNTTCFRVGCPPWLLEPQVKIILMCQVLTIQSNSNSSWLYKVLTWNPPTMHISATYKHNKKKLIIGAFGTDNNN